VTATPVTAASVLMGLATSSKQLQTNNDTQKPTALQPQSVPLGLVFYFWVIKIKICIDWIPFVGKQAEPNSQPQSVSKRYSKEFLISLKDKNLSKQFPDIIHNLSELAITEQRVNLKDTWIPSLKFILIFRYYRV